MYDDFPTLFRYHRESDATYLDAIRNLSAGQYEEVEPFEVGWPSIRSVVVHLAGANDIWARRLLGEMPTHRITEADLPALDDAEGLLLSAHDRFADEILPAMTPERLASAWTYRDLRGDSRSVPIWSVLRHVVNHGTYHRGQLASKIKRRGVTPPITDFVFWISEQVSRAGG
jgi:uncharacterized damage-inducible protein DinB